MVSLTMFQWHLLIRPTVKTLKREKITGGELWKASRPLDLLLNTVSDQSHIADYLGLFGNTSFTRDIYRVEASRVSWLPSIWSILEFIELIGDFTMSKGARIRRANKISQNLRRVRCESTSGTKAQNACRRGRVVV